MPSEPLSVSLWLQQLQAGDHAAAEELWQRYCKRLVDMARRMIRGLPRRVEDEEDLALSAFDSFCRGAIGGRFPSLDDRNNLWRLLVTITARKAYQHGLSMRRQKRGGEAVLDEAALTVVAGGNDEGRRWTSSSAGSLPRSLLPKQPKNTSGYLPACPNAIFA